MTKYYLLKDDGSREFSIYPHHIILDGVWCEEYNEIVELGKEELKLLETFAGMLEINDKVYMERYPYISNAKKELIREKIRGILK